MTYPILQLKQLKDGDYLYGNPDIYPSDYVWVPSEYIEWFLNTLGKLPNQMVCIYHFNGDEIAPQTYPKENTMDTIYQEAKEIVEIIKQSETEGINQERFEIISKNAVSIAIRLCRMDKNIKDANIHDFIERYLY